MEIKDTKINILGMDIDFSNTFEETKKAFSRKSSPGIS